MYIQNIYTSFFYDLLEILTILIIIIKQLKFKILW